MVPLLADLLAQPMPALVLVPRGVMPTTFSFAWNEVLPRAGLLCWWPGRFPTGRTPPTINSAMLDAAPGLLVNLLR